MTTLQLHSKKMKNCSSESRSLFRTLGYLTFTWKKRKFRFENWIASAVPFEKKIWDQNKENMGCDLRRSIFNSFESFWLIWLFGYSDAGHSFTLSNFILSFMFMLDIHPVVCANVNHPLSPGFTFSWTAIANISVNSKYIVSYFCSRETLPLNNERLSLVNIKFQTKKKRNVATILLSRV